MDKDELKKNFITKAKLIQDKEYDYSKVEYVNNKTKVCIICPIHGEFWIRPDTFLSGHMCKLCSIEKRKKLRTMDEGEFISRVKKIFPQYDLSLVKYINSHTYVDVICPIHGIFKIKPYHLLNGHGCKKCGMISTHNKQRKTVENFIEEAKKIHGDKYDYSKVEYKNRDTKVCIICPKHGEFWQTPHGHLNGQGCPICSNSVLEKEVSTELVNLNIEFEQEKKFSWLGLQSLDFYLPQYNIAIECQGIQHFTIVDYFGGEDGFKYRQKNDQKKLRLCNDNGVKLFYYSKFKYPNVYTDIKILINEIKNGREKD